MRFAKSVISKNFHGTAECATTLTCESLLFLGRPQYGVILAENEIDFEALGYCSPNDLEEIGVSAADAVVLLRRAEALAAVG